MPPQFLKATISLPTFFWPCLDASVTQLIRNYVLFAVPANSSP